MNQNQGTSSLSSPDLPMKQKRGRPRKDENLVHGESMPAIPGPDSLKKNKQTAGTNDDVEDEMVGRVVSGVIEGSFDAGYLLNVEVEDTDTQLRAVVFLPGKFTPVTAANDVAPNVKMCKRKEVPIPAVNLQSHVYGSARPSEQSNRQPSEVKKQIPAVPDQIPPRIPQCGIPESLRSQSFSGIPESLSQRISESLRSRSFSGIPESLRSQPTSFVIPPVDNLPKDDAPTLGG
ncbi:protein METABOLIC NETWORK MODULATOR 1-like [Rosa rugosa]|uniref:protein METABOLIC NETWORK MODULATOR 1-like n=1 Tax=Rosa rugosa TaxID=74645 RepID=UPI002B412F0E|nr:protein METABOLIC NETWORK MODULATOR 1-like [Rosa rugosa]XP_062013469.1 protein METABOLIC NETWORK MODULATOR 1-like [Rosa rugosa]XP_062013470.1 protein METABOLIC NETWORK MODULATOR 1-like [Rosa rugosa]XP_062013471.1 protein METABOLIC NETWORK MODULATOR 1-like [Rosa rugosa]